MNRIAIPRRLLLFGAPVVVLLIIVVVAIGVIRSGGSGDSAKLAGSPTASSAGLLDEGINRQQQLDPSLLTARENAGGVTGTNPNAAVPGASSGGDHLVIPSINVDAVLSERIVTPAANGATEMPNPNGPNDVVWYDFSAFPGLGGRPGVGGNTVLSGHVDYHDYGPAIFWNLGKLNEGDEIIIQLADGSSYHYAVKWNRVVDPSSTSWNQIVASTPQESLTMITCAGTFDSSSRSYDERRVVWAVRTS